MFLNCFVFFCFCLFPQETRTNLGNWEVRPHVYYNIHQSKIYMIPFKSGCLWSLLKSIGCFVRLLLSAASSLIFGIVGNDETATEYPIHETVFVEGDTRSKKRGNAGLKKQCYLFLIKYYVTALNVCDHMTPLFLSSVTSCLAALVFTGCLHCITLWISAE